MLVWRAATLAFLSMWFVYLAGCSGRHGYDDGEESSLSFPPEVVFDPVDIGQTTRSQLFVENTGTQVVTIRSITVEQSLYGDPGVFGVDDPGEIRLKPGAQAVVTVSYTSEAFYDPFGGAIFDTSEGNYYVHLQATLPTARLGWYPAGDVFPEIPVGECQSAEFEFYNAGDVALEMDVSDFRDDQNEFSISSDSLASLPFTLTPRTEGSTPTVFPLTVEYCPQIDGDGYAQLFVGWLHSDRVEEVSAVPIGRNLRAPCLQLRSTSSRGQISSIDFGETLVGTTASQVLRLLNCAAGEFGRDLIVHSISLVDETGATLGEPYSLTELPEIPVAIPPGGYESITLDFLPLQAGEEELATLVIETNAESNAVVEIPISGLGSDNLCPTVGVHCRLDGSSTFQSNGMPPVRTRATVECAVRQSADPDGSVVAHEWSILGSPPGSTASLADPDAEEIFWQPDVQGEYTIQLDALDNDGRRACEPATTRVSAVYVEGISAELVWDVPGDPDPTDEGEGSGGDLDLHVLNASNGCWGNPEWDCHVDNPSLNWGVPFSPLDDARVLVADSSTGGPENITIDTPADGSYRFGVLYRNDHGFGPADATLRVFAAGVLILEQTRSLTTTGEFWDVGVVTVPGLEAAVQDEVWPSLADATCP